MEIASNKGVIADASTPAGRAGMSESEWREAIKFDSTDTGWVIMSIGMAIGAGIVFLPVQVGLMGLWVFLLSSVIGYPAMYLFQRLFINTLAESPECKDYPSVISGYGWDQTDQQRHQYRYADCITAPRGKRPQRGGCQ